MPDIDIDFPDRNKVLEFLDHRIAMRVGKEGQVKHNTGVYFQEIPHDPLTNMSTIDYEAAESRGYFKIDLLNVSIYQDIRNEEHLDFLLNKEPDWSLLEHREIIDQLFHINGHSDLIKKLKPDSIPKLAAVLAIIRPSKRHLVNEDWNTIEQEVWTRPTDESYFFKRSHAIAYASAIVVQLNLIEEQALAATN